MAIMDEAAAKKADYFKQRRQEALGQVQGQQQQAQDVIQRRFASLGAQGSGAQMAMEQKAREAGAAQTRQVEQDITGQEIAAQEPELQRRFQSEQMKQQQEFASRESQLGREAQLGESEKQRQFMAGESQASRTLQQQLAADDLKLKQSLANMQQANTAQELELAKKQFDIDKETTDFNKMLSLIMAGVPIEEARKSTMIPSSDVSAVGAQSNGGQSAAAPPSPQMAMYNNEFSNLQKEFARNLSGTEQRFGRLAGERKRAAQDALRRQFAAQTEELKKKYGVA